MAISVGEVEAILKLRDEMSSQLQVATRNLKGFGKSAMDVGKQLTYITAPLAAIGGLAVHAAADFNSSMTKVVTLGGSTRQQVDALRESVMRLSGETGVKARDLGDALFFVSSAGIRGSEGFKVLEMAAKASAVGMGTTAVVADVLTSVMNAYGKSGMTAAQAMDILVRTVQEGKMPTEALAGSLGKVLANASASGVKFAEVGAFVATLTRQGIEATMATTGLNSVLAQFVNPSKQAKDALNLVGLSMAGLKQEIREKGLISALNHLTTAFKDNDDGLGAVVGDARSWRAVMATVGTQAETYAAILKSTSTAQGALGTAFAETAKGFNLQMARIKEKVEGAAIALGQGLMPAMQKAAVIVEGLALSLEHAGEWFQRLPGWVQQTTASLGGLVVAASAALLGVAALAKVLAVLGGAISLIVGSSLAGWLIQSGRLISVMGGAGLALIFQNAAAAVGELAVALWSLWPIAVTVGAVFASYKLGDLSGLTDWVGKKLAGAFWGVTEAQYAASRAAADYRAQNVSVIEGLQALKSLGFDKPLISHETTTDRKRRLDEEAKERAHAAAAAMAAVDQERIKRVKEMSEEMSGKKAIDEGKEAMDAFMQAGGKWWKVGGDQLDTYREKLDAMIAAYHQLGKTAEATAAKMKKEQTFIPTTRSFAGSMADATYNPLYAGWDDAAFKEAAAKIAEVTKEYQEKIAQYSMSGLALELRNIETAKNATIKSLKLVGTERDKAVKLVEQQSDHMRDLAIQAADAWERNAMMPELVNETIDTFGVGVKVTRDWTSQIKNLSESFKTLGSTLGEGKFTTMVQSFADVAGSMGMARDSAQTFRDTIVNATGTTERVVGLTTSFLQLAAAMEQATSSGNKAQNIVGGAMTGATMGYQATESPYGALIGGIAGAFYGWWKSSEEEAKALEAFKEMRAQYYLQAGGVEVLSRQLALAGFNAKLLFDARDPEAWAAALKAAQNATIEFEKKVAGVEQAMAGVSEYAAAFLKPYQDQLDAIAEAKKNIASLREAGKIEEADTEAAKMARDIDALKASALGAQPAFERLGIYIQAAFGAGLKVGKTPMEMFAALKGAFATLATGTADLGLSSTPTIAKMLGMQKLVEKNAGVFDTLGSLTKMWEGFSAAGMIGQLKKAFPGSHVMLPGGMTDLATTMAKDVVAQFRAITDAGGTEADFKTAMALNQPLLQQMWEAQKKFGAFSDQGVIDLLAAAEASGFVGKDMMAVQDRMLETLVEIRDILSLGSTGASGSSASPGGYVDPNGTVVVPGGSTQVIVIEIDGQEQSRRVVRDSPREIRTYVR